MNNRLDVFIDALEKFANSHSGDLLGAIQYAKKQIEIADEKEESFNAISMDEISDNYGSCCD